MQKIMKILSVITILMFSGTALFSQTDTVFTVRLGNFFEPQPEDFDDLRSVGFLFADSIAADLDLISMGMYSTRGRAAAVAAAAKAKNYPDADVEPFLIRKNKPIQVIQMATLSARKSVKWQEIYAAYPNISIKSLDDQLLIFATGFKDRTEANAALAGIRSSGFSGAFPKVVSSEELIDITEFETGGIERPEQKVVSKVLQIEKKEVSPPPTKVVDLKPIEPDPTPEIIQPVKPSPQTSVPERRFEYPEIDGKIKRNAAIELQRALKAEKVYSGSLDGFYGPGTTRGYSNFKEKNRQWKKYVLLSELWNNDSDEDKNKGIQRAIFDAFESPIASSAAFAKSTNPLAIAYSAFLDFRANGASQSVNDKMNSAIERSFPSKKLGNIRPFDYTATYAYRDYEQLLLHLKYLHMASEDNLAVPCWVFSAFPKESEKVFRKFSKRLKFQDCTGVEDWEELRVLKAIALDISPSVKQRNGAVSARKSRMLLNPSNLSKSEQLNAVKWNDVLMGNLSGWATRDPMHDELVSTFKVAYYQSQVRLESYFIKNKIRPDQARFLAISTLKALIGKQLERFTS